ncbi:MAG: AAA family ATPase [Chloroflexi bacterium]|jgi:CO dehydrogenase maturation factor|nr:AAA family ATPase [Chloroflexota bacterium]MBT4002566.1 AAA family ATPase [Chloroflexota bacterium]MBT4305896.1 AAA family ATPase [Chloroflexota bacterium]MBT4533721.1 AAA family ATPase [Chloroflexota bacterium]MBT4681636.1 AAA family ATPase [Chloroflexota bacterium]
MKIAVSGKGGVGKTTITALIAQAFADSGKDVLAVDADPSPCLADALCFPSELKDSLHPIAEMEDLIYERTGAKPGASGGFFSLNPRVDDIPDKFSVKHRGVRLLEMGSVEFGGGGCICPEGAMVKTLFTHLLFRKDEVLLLDMYAGVEHLGRATVDFVDAMLIVVEPTNRSLNTSTQIIKLATDIGLNKIYLVANKIRNEGDVEFIEKFKPDIPLLANFNSSQKVNEADHLNVAVYDHVKELKEEAMLTVKRLYDLSNID